MILFDSVFGVMGINNASIDLHGGLSVQKAKTLVLQRIKEAHAAGIYEVLIITGRGAHVNQNGSRGIIKQNLPTWLELPEVKSLIKELKANTGSYQLSLKPNKLARIIPTKIDDIAGILTDVIRSHDLNLLKTQAAQKNAQAQGLLGFLHLTGTVVEKKLDVAANLLRAAARGNDPLSQLLLAELHAKGLHGVAKQSDKDTLFWYEAVINSGTNHAIEAHFRLGIAYLLGQGARQNDEKALYHLNLAARGGSGLACLNLAIMYEEQYLTCENVDKTINTWLLKAAIKNVIDAQVRIAKRYLSGAGMSAPNLEQAHYWFEKAANNRDVDSQCVIATAYYKGDGVAQDIALFEKYINMAALQGHPYAETELAYYLLCVKPTSLEDLERGKKFLDEALAQNNPRAMVLFAKLLNRGHRGIIAQNIELSTKWLIKAASLGDKDACLILYEHFWLQLTDDAKERLSSWIEIHALNGDLKAKAIINGVSFNTNNTAATPMVTPLDVKSLIGAKLKDVSAKHGKILCLPTSVLPFSKIIDTEFAKDVFLRAKLNFQNTDFMLFAIQDTFEKATILAIATINPRILQHLFVLLTELEALKDEVVTHITRETAATFSPEERESLVGTLAVFNHKTTINYQQLCNVFNELAIVHKLVIIDSLVKTIDRFIKKRNLNDSHFAKSFKEQFAKYSVIRQVACTSFVQNSNPIGVNIEPNALQEIEQSFYNLQLDLEGLDIEQKFKIDDGLKRDTAVVRHIVHITSGFQFDGYFDKIPIKKVILASNTIEGSSAELFNSSEFTGTKNGKPKVLIAVFANIQSDEVTKILVHLPDNHIGAMSPIINKTILQERKMLILFFGGLASLRLDLHGFNRPQAMTREKLNLRNRFFEFLDGATLIPGAGNHSIDGVPKLLTDLTHLLKNWKAENKNFVKDFVVSKDGGLVKIIFQKPAQISSFMREIPALINQKVFRVELQLNEALPRAERERQAIQLSQEFYVKPYFKTKCSVADVVIHKIPQEEGSTKGVRLFFSYKSCKIGIFNTDSIKSDDTVGTYGHMACNPDGSVQVVGREKMGLFFKTENQTATKQSSQASSVVEPETQMFAGLKMGFLS